MATIIITDDDPIVRQFAIELLRGSDHVVVEAEHGREALSLIAAMPVDILVVDMLMPEMDGLETILALRHAHPDLKILAISSGGRIGAQRLLDMARTFGADEVLQKPLALATFRAVIDRLLTAPACAERRLAV